jgi:glutamate-1-semialdehyde 2,1-aminomutase
VQGLQQAAEETGHEFYSGHVSGMFGFFFCAGPVHNYEDAKQADVAKFGRFHRGMLEQGIYLAPSQFEAGFTSLAHTEADIDKTIAAAKLVMSGL